MAIPDKIIGAGLILASLSIFIYYTTWVLLLVSEQ